MPRTLSQIAKEQKVIAKMYFHNPIIKTKEVFYSQEPIKYCKKNSKKQPRVGKMLGEI
jgi:hypothetical protein